MSEDLGREWSGTSLTRKIKYILTEERRILPDAGWRVKSSSISLLLFGGSHGHKDPIVDVSSQLLGLFFWFWGSLLTSWLCLWLCLTICYVQNLVSPDRGEQNRGEWRGVICGLRKKKAFSFKIYRSKKYEAHERQEKKTQMAVLWKRRPSH